MSNDFMADPIRPGDLKAEQTLTNRLKASNTNDGGKKAVLIIFLIFVVPFIIYAIVFLRIWSDIGPDIVSQIKEGANDTSYYEITNEQQMAAARIFSTSILYEKGGPKTISQSDCRHLKNAVTSYFNYTLQPAQWYDNTYCSADTVNIAAYFINENEDGLGGRFARIDIGPKDGELTCLNIMFAENFRYIIASKKLGHCVANKVKIEVDHVNVPEIEPQFKANDEPDEDAEESLPIKTKNTTLRY